MVKLRIELNMNSKRKSLQFERLRVENFLQEDNVAERKTNNNADKDIKNILQ